MHKDFMRLSEMEKSDATARQQRDRWDLLMKAIEHRNLGIVEDALEYGVNVNARYGDRTEIPLTLAAKTGDLAIVEALTEHGASVILRDNEEKTPREIAAEAGHKDIEDYLANQESPLNQKEVEDFVTDFNNFFNKPSP